MLKVIINNINKVEKQMAVQTNSKEYEPTTLAGYAFYAFVHSPQKDEEYGDKYKIDLVVENEDGTPFVYVNPSNGEEINMLEKVEELGLQLKESPSIPGRYVRISSKAQTKDGKDRPPIPVADANKKPIEDLIGNGSKVRVRALLNHYKVGRNVGISALLDRMIVDDLVPYVSKKGDDEFDFPHMRKSNKGVAMTSNSKAPEQAASKGKFTAAAKNEEVPFEEE